MIKLTIFLSVDQATPTETWYFPGLSGAQDQTVQATVINVVNARAALLGRGATIIGVRLVDSASPRFAVYLRPGIYASTGNINAGVDDQGRTDRDYSSLVWTAALQGGKIARRYIAGGPDGAIGSAPGNVRGYQSFQDFGDKFNAYVFALSQNGAEVRTALREDQEVLDVVTLGQFPGLVGVKVNNQITFVPPFFGLGNPVRAISLRGFRSVNPRAAGLHGIYRVAGEVPPVSPASTPWTYFLYGTSDVNTANIEVRGQASALAFQAEGVLSGVITQATHHKRGGRAFLPVGRSKTRP